MRESRFVTFHPTLFRFSVTNSFCNSKKLRSRVSVKHSRQEKEENTMCLADCSQWLRTLSFSVQTHGYLRDQLDWHQDNKIVELSSKPFSYSN